MVWEVVLLFGTVAVAAAVPRNGTIASGATHGQEEPRVWSRGTSGTSGTLPTATRTPHETVRMVRTNQVVSGDPRSQGSSSVDFTEPRWRENAANADLELPTDRGDLGLVHKNLRNASNCHQDPSPDCQNGQVQPGSLW